MYASSFYITQITKTHSCRYIITFFTNIIILSSSELKRYTICKLYYSIKYCKNKNNYD